MTCAGNKCLSARTFASSAAFGAALWLAACAADGPPGAPGETGAPTSQGEPLAVECAPFARTLSGLQLTGNAADWWWRADGRYARASTPEVGAVLVFRRTARLANGHVAVVSQVVADREIQVTHANWVRHYMTPDQPVIDVSPDNDWTLVRVWWPPSGQMGASAYPTDGFILPDRPVSPDQLTAAIPDAIARAGGLR